MATNIPPHNLTEVINGVVKIIDNQVDEGRETDLDEIMEIIKGPDFPTGATILGRRGIEEAYRTGHGKIRVRAVTDIEPMANGKNRIIVTELPYMVNKARLIEKIAELHKDKRIDGITELRDESSREGMRICIELRKDVNANVILNQLYKHTQMQDTFGVNMLALVNNEPVVMNLLQMLQYYLKHQEEVVTRRTKYDLNKAEERAHILKGLLIALDNIDEVIKIIRGSESAALAKERLIERVGPVSYTHLDVYKRQEQDGIILVNAKMISEIVRRLPDDDVNFEVDENNNILLFCGKSKFNIPGIPHDEFPMLSLIHIYVYKRQPSLCVSTYLSACNSA